MNATANDRALPAALDSETQVIGSMLLAPECIGSVDRQLRPTDYVHPLNRAAHIVITAMRREGLPIDVATVRAKLDTRAEFKGESTLAYLAEVGEACVTAAHVAFHVAEVAEASLKRRLHFAATDVAQDSLNGKASSEILADLGAIVEDFRRERPSSSSPRFTALSAAELDDAKFETNWLVDWMIVEGMPTILAGGKKCLKTTMLVDLGLSIATGGEFLGEYPVRDAKRYLLCSGESGLPTLQETSRRIAKAKGWRLRDVPHYMTCEDLPRLDSAEDLAAWESFIAEREAEVVAIDPAFLCMPGDNADNLFKTGALLANVSTICRRLGVTLILCHHTKKSRAGDLATHDPPELEDVAWAGFQEFARQWLLVGRRERYVPGTGEHRLWLNYGGSAGHSGLLAVDLAEGHIHDGRHYQVALCKPGDARDSDEQRKAEAKDRKLAVQLDADVRKLVNTLAKLPGGQATKTEWKTRSGLNTARFSPALAAALEAGHVVPCDITKTNKHTYEGYKINDPDSPGLTQSD